MPNKIYVRSLGLAIFLAIYEDNVGASPQILWRKPDGTTGAWPADYVTKDDIKCLRYITASEDDLPRQGTYRLQADLGLPGVDLPGNTADLIVYKRFQ